MILKSIYRRAMPLAARNMLWGKWSKCRSLIRIAFGRLISVTLLLISPIVLVRVGRISPNRIGHMIVGAETYLRLLCERRGAARQIDILIVLPMTEPVNPVMWDLILKHAPISRHRIVHKVLGFAHPGLLRNRNFLDVNDFKLYFEALKEPPAFTLSEQEINRGRKALEQFGLKPTDWYVCMANRDSAYLDAIEPDKSWNYHDFRDSSVANLTGAAEEVVRRGGFVFRMGTMAAEPWPGQDNERIVDIASAPHDSFLDIFLSATCRFFIASNSGINHIPTAFGRRVSTTNCVPVTRLCPPSGGFTLPKLFRDKNTGKFLHFREAKRRGLFDRHNDIALQRSHTYAALGVEAVENDNQDMQGLCRDMFEYSDRTEVPDEMKELQDFYEREYLGPDHPHRGMGSPIAPSFLMRHRHLIT